MKKAFIFPFIIILTVLSLTGCWNLTEPEELSLDTVIGINLTSRGQYEVIVQNQTLVSGGQQIQKSNWTFDIHKSTGSTIYGAMQRNEQINPEKLYLSHTKAIIISEELARKKGIRSVIDFLGRNSEVRHNTLFLISKKGEFEKIFLPNAKLNTDTGEIIERIVKNKNSDSFLLESKLKNILELYWGAYTTPYASGIGTVQSFIDHKSIDQRYENVDVNTYDIDVGDIAVFKNDKMAGWLTGDTSRGFLWINGMVNGGSVNVSYKGKPVVLKISHSKSRIKPVVKDGKVIMEIRISVEANIGESYADINFDNNNVIGKISKKLDAKVSEEARKAINASKSLDTNPLINGWS